MSRRDKNKINKARRANAKARAEREDSAREYLSFSSNEFNRIESMAAEVLLRDGHHTTVHMVFGEIGRMHLIADTTSDGRVVDLVAKTARRHGAVAVVSVGQAWVAIVEENSLPTVPVSRIPGSFEALIVAVESACESRSAVRRINRNGNGVRLGEREDGLSNPWGGDFGHLFDGDARSNKSDGK